MASEIATATDLSLTASVTNKQGSLTIAGSGIASISHITLETLSYIKESDKIFYLVCDPLTESFIKDNSNGPCASLAVYYDQEKDRYDSYIQMCEVMLREVRAGLHVLGVFYGHPGVFVNPSHRAIAIAREEGFKAKMLAGVSAEDCLFADLEFDPATLGCMTCEASECLARDRPFNPFVHNIIWQVGSIGILNMSFNNDKFSLLVDRLEKDFGPEHTVIHYVGRVLPQSVSKIETFSVADLRKEDIRNHFDAVSTLYVPPRDMSPVDPCMAEKLGASAGGRVGAIEAFRPSLKWSALNINRKLSYTYNRYESDVVARLKDHVIPEGHRILQGSPAIKKFLTDLALKPRLLEEYRSDPEMVVDRVDGLTDNEKYGLKLGTDGPVYALMSKTVADIASGRELTKNDIEGGQPVGLVSAVIIALIVCAV